MSFVDPDSIHTPTAGLVAPAAWGQTVAADLNFLADPDRVKVYRSSNQSIGHDSPTDIAWPAEEWDTNNLHSTSVNTNRLVAQVAGRYQGSLAVTWAANASGVRVVEIWKNGTSGVIIARDSDTSPSAGTSSRQNVTFEVELDVGDYVNALAFQTSGGNLNLIGAAIGGNERSWMSLRWIGI